MAQGKHFKKTGTSYKVRSLAVAAVTAGLLLTPNVAFASGTIGDSAFEDGTASQDEAQTWVWDGAGNMTLNKLQRRRDLFRRQPHPRAQRHQQDHEHRW